MTQATTVSQRPCKRGHVAGRNKSGCCLECQRMAVRAYRARDPEAARKRTREAKRAAYGTAALRKCWKYRGMPEPTRPAPAACEACGVIATKTLHLDHDHATGAFRGWLCGNCNRGMGLFADSIERLHKAAEYLARHGSK